MLLVNSRICCIIDQLQIHAIRDQERVDNNSQFLQQAVNDSKAKCLWTSPLTQQLTHKCELCYELSIDIFMWQIS